MRLRVHLAHLIRWLSEPVCPVCRQPLHRCRRDEWWHD